MKRILHINDYPVNTGGGAEVLMGQTVDLLRNDGFDARTFTSADLSDTKLTARRYLNNHVARASLAEKLHHFKPEVVHLHNYYHLLSPGILIELAKYRRTRPLRVVMTAHDYHLVCPNSGGNWFSLASQRFRAADGMRLGSRGYLLSRRWDVRGWAYSSLKLAQHVWNYRWRSAQGVIERVICPSRFLQTMLDPGRLPTCWLSYPAPPLRRNTEPRPGPLHLVFAGRVEPEKGLRRFLEIMPDSFAGIFTVIGDGSDLPACKATATQRGLAGRVTFLGRRPHAETMERIAKAHVLVLPSVFLENQPLCLLEALAAGTSVLTNDLGGMKEIVATTGVGELFRPHHPQSLADALTRIEALHRAGTLNAFDLSDFFAARSPRRYLDQLLAIYATGRAA
jgi:glycosyltransferase involved in cell wall biosynthesis